MTYLKCKKSIDNSLIFSKVEKPNGFFSRNNGLMLRKNISEDFAFMITGCHGIGWIHTLFMMFPIDIIYINKKMEIKKIKRNIKSFRLTLPVFGTDSVIECSANNSKINTLSVGDKIYVEA